MRHSPLPFACWKSVSWLKNGEIVKVNETDKKNKKYLSGMVGAPNHVCLFGWLRYIRSDSSLRYVLEHKVVWLDISMQYSTLVEGGHS